MSDLWIEKRKWPDRSHQRATGSLLGEDEHGVWIQQEVGAPLHRHDGSVRYGRGGLLLVPPEQGWIARFPATGDLDLYVDVVTNVVRTPSAIAMVDLDLDIVRWKNGEVELLDEDDFERRRVELGYPDYVVQQALRVATQVLASVRAGEPPLDGAAAREWSSTHAY